MDTLLLLQNNSETAVISRLSSSSDKRKHSRAVCYCVSHIGKSHHDSQLSCDRVLRYDCAQRLPHLHLVLLDSGKSIFR